MFLINLVVYIVKKEMVKTSLRKSLKVFIAALVTIAIAAFLMNLYNSKQTKVQIRTSRQYLVQPKTFSIELLILALPSI